MANYIMSLGQEKEKLALPSSGSYTLDIPKGKKPGGKFVLMASYTDKGADGIEPLRTFSNCLLYTSPSPRDRTRSRMPSSA